MTNRSFVVLVLLISIAAAFLSPDGVSVGPLLLGGITILITQVFYLVATIRLSMSNTEKLIDRQKSEFQDEIFKRNLERANKKHARQAASDVQRDLR